MSLVRTFIGVHLDDSLVDRIEDLIMELRRKPGGEAARWVAGHNVHLTVKFLGDVESDALPAISDAVATAVAEMPPVAIEVAGLGCFPNTQRPRIVWAGLRGELNALNAMQQAVEDALEPLGHEREARPFSPHLTIARVNRRATPGETAALGRTIADYGPVSLGSMQVTTVSVIRSDLRPEGPAYTDLSVAPLGTTA
jgi:RNA 2',3'-cyclic 3'-phosphodiesterase